MSMNAKTELPGSFSADTLKCKPSGSQNEEEKAPGAIGIKHKPSDFFRVLCEGAVAGATAGVVVESVLYPIDTIKTRLQAVHGGGKIIWRGLYSGLAGNLAGVLPESNATFSVSGPEHGSGNNNYFYGMTKLVISSRILQGEEAGNSFNCIRKLNNLSIVSQNSYCTGTLSCHMNCEWKSREPFFALIWLLSEINKLRCLRVLDHMNKKMFKFLDLGPCSFMLDLKQTCKTKFSCRRK